jgi:hypothetical protein
VSSATISDATEVSASTQAFLFMWVPTAAAPETDRSA